MYGVREITLSPVDPPAFVALADLRTLAGVTGTGSDVLLSSMGSAVAAMIEVYCASVIAQRTITETMFPEDPLQTLVLSHLPLFRENDLNCGSTR